MLKNLNRKVRFRNQIHYNKNSHTICVAIFITLIAKYACCFLFLRYASNFTSWGTNASIAHQKVGAICRSC